MDKRVPKRISADVVGSIDLHNISYRKRYFAFIDILGFTHLIRRTQRDRKLLKQLTKALEITFQTSKVYDLLRSHPVQKLLETSRKEYLERRDKPFKPDSRDSFATQRALAFSDTVVLAAGPTFNNLYNLLVNSTTLALGLLNIETFVRGAISLGSIYFEGSIVFGPALVEAYTLERDLAVYPRIIVSDDIVKMLETSQSTKRKNGARERCRSLIRMDFDGLYHLNILSKEGMRLCTFGTEEYFVRRGNDELYGWRAGLRRIRGIIVKCLNSEAKKDLRTKAKIRWFAQYFNSIVTAEERLEIEPVNLK